MNIVNYIWKYIQPDLAQIQHFCRNTTPITKNIYDMGWVIQEWYRTFAVDPEQIVEKIETSSENQNDIWTVYKVGNKYIKVVNLPKDEYKLSFVKKKKKKITIEIWVEIKN